MLQLLFANNGTTKAFKKVMLRLSSKLLDDGYASSVDFNEKFTVASIHLDNFRNFALLGSTLTFISNNLSEISLDIDGFDCSNLYPDIVRFCKNV